MLRPVDIAALGAQRSQRRDRGEVGSTFLGLRHDGEGVVVASDRLEDRCPFGIHYGGICSEAPGFVEVFQRIGEAMEYGPRPGAREEGYAVSRAIVRELFGPRLRPFVVCDGTEDVAAQRHQFDERGLTTNIEPSGEGLALLAVDLCLQIRQRERPCGRG